jgi:hypothetical protein
VESNASRPVFRVAGAPSHTFPLEIEPTRRKVECIFAAAECGGAVFPVFPQLPPQLLAADFPNPVKVDT